MLFRSRTPVANTKSVMGLFWDERYKSILEAALNLVVSVLLANRLGITGILVGTLVSTLALPVWIEPLGLYRHGLGLPVGRYFRDYLFYLLVTVSAGTATWLACRMLPGGLGGFFLRMLLCLTLPNLIYLAVVRKVLSGWGPLLRLIKPLLPGRNKQS